MTQQKFVACKRNQTQKINDWYERCKKEKIPYVVAELRSKYADVRFDYITLPKECDDHLTKNANQITEKAIQIFKKYAIKGSKYSVSGVLINFDNMPINQSEKAAEELYDLMKSFLPA